MRLMLLLQGMPFVDLAHLRKVDLKGDLLICRRQKTGTELCVKLMPQARQLIERYRVTFNEITKKVVNESIAAPRAIDQDLVDAQQARRILDRIVGYQLSPLLWKKIRRGLSAGRVQSVAFSSMIPSRLLYS